MAERIVATLNIPFGDDDGLGSNAGKNRIILQQMTKRFDFEGRLWLRCYCGIPYQLATSVGSVEKGSVFSQNVWQEVLKFNNSSSATLKYPTASGVTITPRVLMRKVERYGQTRLEEATNVHLRYDAEKTAVIAEAGVPGNRKPVNVWGIVFVSYTATYDFLYYRPSTEPIGFTGGVQWNIGTVYAYHEYDVASVEIELDITSAETTAEYARVYSKIVLDPKGVWEFPPNWQETYEKNQKKTGEEREDYSNPGQFPGHFATIDADNCFVDERVHLIIKVNTMGQLFYEYPKGIVSIYAPWWGSSNYYPQYHCRFAEPPGGSSASSAEEFLFRLNNRGWHTVFLGVDKDAVKSRLESNYPNIKFDSKGNP